MKEKVRSILVVLMMAVFVNFVFSNSVFMHTHKDGTYGSVTHSHPYLPLSTHGHTHGSFDQIAGFNAAAAAFQAAVTFDLPTYETHTCLIECFYRPVPFMVRTDIISLRAPPSSLLF